MLSKQLLVTEETREEGMAVGRLGCGCRLAFICLGFGAGIFSDLELAILLIFDISMDCLRQLLSIL